MCYQISDTGLFHLEDKHTYTLQEFHDTQFKQLQEVQLHTLWKLDQMFKLYVHTFLYHLSLCASSEIHFSHFHSHNFLSGIE